VSFQAKESYRHVTKIQIALLSCATMALLALSAAGCVTVDQPISASNASSSRDLVGNQSVALPGW
jgi:hypothetical protein